MWIELRNTVATVTRSTEDEIGWLREYLSFPDANARFRPNPGDGRVRMLNEFSLTFPAGFVSMVRKASADENVKVEIVDLRSAAVEDPSADVAWLRSYQAEALTASLAKKRGIVWIPTGGGKTEVLVALVRRVPEPWLFLVHRTSLAQQAADRFSLRNREHGVDLGEPGVIGEGRWTEGEYLTCATFQTIAKALKKGDPRAQKLIARTRCLAVDECHVLPAESFWNVAQAMSHAYYRIGLSGTPLARGDRRSILAMATLGPVIYRLRSETLVNAGVLAKPKVRMLTVVQPPANAATFQGVYGLAVVKSAARNAALVELAERATKPALMFVKEIRHGHSLVSRLMAKGMRADFTHGNHSTDYRKSMVSRLTRADLDVLVCSVIFQEGIDIPELRSVINAGGSKSVIAALQKLGRGMRVDRAPDGSVREGGDVFELFDILDVGNEWLEKHSRSRKNAYLSEGFETIVEPPLASSLSAQSSRASP